MGTSPRDVSFESRPLYSDLKQLARPPRVRAVAALCLFAVAFYFAYRYAMSFTNAKPAPFWFPDAVLLCALLRTPVRWWWLPLLVTLPIRLSVAVPTNTPLWFLLSVFLNDCAKGVIAAALLRRLLADPIRFHTVRDFGLYCAVALALVPAASAFGGAASRWALGNDYWTSWTQWFLGNTLAALIVTPFMFYWILRPPNLRHLTAVRCVEAVALAAGLLVSISVALESTDRQLGFLDPRFAAPVFCLCWAAIRFGMYGASAAAALLSFLSISPLLSGGPLAHETVGDPADLQRFLMLRVAPMYLVAVLIEQARRAEHSLRESEHRFRHMADTAPVLIWLSGPDARCEFVNKGWRVFTGRRLEEELGEGWMTAVNPQDRPLVHATYRRRFDARAPCEMEYRLRRHDGEDRWILDRGIPRYADDGEFLGFIGCAIDVTERRQQELSLRESEERYREVNRNLAHASRLAALGELTAMIAHQISQPLTAILNNAEAAEKLLATDAPPLAELREILIDIRNDDLRADEAVRSIRALTRKREVQLAPLDINATVAEVIRMVTGDALSRRVQIECVLAPNLPLVAADRVNIEQVLLNLIVNGMDAMQDVPPDARQLTVRTRLDADHTVVVSVIDHGHGIPADELSKLFDSFFTTKSHGMGLGLSIARSIMLEHQGRIWAESPPAGGAAFHFSLRRC